MLRLIFSYTRFFHFCIKSVTLKYIFSHQIRMEAFDGAKAILKEVFSKRSSFPTVAFTIFPSLHRSEPSSTGCSRPPTSQLSTAWHSTDDANSEEAIFLGPKKRESSLLKNHFLLQYFPTSNRSDFLQK